MMQEVFKQQFVEFIPEELQEGILYVSMRFATVSHLCACGCGTRVVTPLKPTDWSLIFDGKTITLHPSIGNWNFPCRSHYSITKGRVEWEADWSKERVAAGRARDRRAKERYYSSSSQSQTKQQRKAPTSNHSWWKRLWPI